MSVSPLSLDRDVIDVLRARHVPSSAPLDGWPISASEDLTPAAFDLGRTIRERVTSTPGFIVVHLRGEELDDAELCSAAWNLFTAHCRPVPQYRTGELIYPVEVAAGGSGASHYSMSSAAGGFHTDGTLLPEQPEVAALLGLSAAESGGETVLMDGEQLCGQLEARDPRYVDVLAEAHHIDLMGQDDRVTRTQPIVRRTERGIRLTYLRYYIERGYEKEGLALPPVLREAMDALDALSSREENQIATRLRRGDFLIWDNYRFLHGRRAFTEGGTARRLRRMYGMWR